MKGLLLGVFLGCCSATPVVSIVGEGPFGTLVSVTLFVADAPVSHLGRYDREFSFTVLGGTGAGALVIPGYLGATSFHGTSDYVDSWARVTAPFAVSTAAYLPQGGVGVSCYGCLVPFVFGVRQEVMFSAEAYAAYRPGAHPQLTGHQIQSFVSLYAPTVYSYAAHGDVDATVVFGGGAVGEWSVVPEPNTWAMVLAGVALVAWRGRKKR